MIGVIERSSDRMIVVDLESKQLQNNIIMVTGEITQDRVTEWQSMIFYLMGTMTPKESVNNPIQIYINSYGGSVYDGLGLYDTIQLAKSKGYIVRTVNIGTCASMASIILMSGSEGHRDSMPNCSVMLHELSYGDFGKFSEMEDSVNEAKRLQEKLNKIIRIHTNFDPNNFNRKDVWMDAETAKKYNIIDNII